MNVVQYEWSTFMGFARHAVVTCIQVGWVITKFRTSKLVAKRAQYGLSIENGNIVHQTRNLIVKMLSTVTTGQRWRQNVFYFSCYPEDDPEIKSKHCTSSRISFVDPRILRALQKLNWKSSVEETRRWEFESHSIQLRSFSLTLAA